MEENKLEESIDNEQNQEGRDPSDHECCGGHKHDHEDSPEEIEHGGDEKMAEEESGCCGECDCDEDGMTLEEIIIEAIKEDNETVSMILGVFPDESLLAEITKRGLSMVGTKKATKKVAKKATKKVAKKIVKKATKKVATKATKKVVKKVVTKTVKKVPAKKVGKTAKKKVGRPSKK